MQPDVDAVQALMVNELIDIVPANVVMVQVVPPTQVLALRVTSSAEVGADAPVHPVSVAHHIAVDVLSQVQVVEQTANRVAACARSGARNTSARRKRPKSFFMAMPSRCLNVFDAAGERRSGRGD
jgi:hypothetical protein